MLAAGGLGDRYGRRGILLAGLVVFGATSAFAGSAGSPNELILGRALMGVGAALIFPATLAILTNVFRDPVERAKAIGVWSAISGVAVAAGPITGGWLLERFWWGSVFYVNVPVAIVAVAATFWLVPESKESRIPNDTVGDLYASLEWRNEDLTFAGLTGVSVNQPETPEIDFDARVFDISPMFTSDGATEITCEEGPA